MTVDDIAALRRGDLVAQEHFLRQYSSSLFATIARMVGNIQDAEELTQDALFKALDSIGSYKPELASFDTWLTRIAYNTALNHLRSTQPHQQLSISEMHVEPAASCDAAMAELFEVQEDKVQELSTAIGQLTTEEQTIVILYYYDERPIRDIAYITGMQPNSIATRLH